MCTKFNITRVGNHPGARLGEEKPMLKTFAVGTLVALTMTVAASNASAAGPATRDIVDTAVAAGSFTTLATALAAADLIGTLKGKGPVTVFAPTAKAFAKLTSGAGELVPTPRHNAKRPDSVT